MPRGQNFYFRVYGVVRRIPRGRVATYGQVAAVLGSPRSAQMVGWALNALKPDTKVPWQRVINREGMISITNRRATKSLQAELLKQEGIDVDFRDGNFWVDMKRYAWQPESVDTGKG